MSDAAPAAERMLVRAAWAVATAYALYGLGAMVLLAPRVPYADPWRFLATFLERPFPADVLASDNGHREVLPNLLRVCELEWFAASQWLQILAGTVLAVAAFGVALRALRPLSPSRRALGAASIAAGLFWLGNGRKLTHGNESVHLFLVVLLLLTGLGAIVRDQRGVAPRSALIAALCGTLATFSFGSGLACFPAFAVVMFLQGASVRQLLLLAGAAALATLGLVAGTTREPFSLLLGERVDLLLRWLGGPSIWAFSPFLDPAHAARMPNEPLQFLTLPVAEVMHDTFGPRLFARWPAFAFGAFGLSWLLWATVRAYRASRGTVERLALGLAWFGVGVGMLVVGLRVEYFRQFPKEVTTPRYIPWSMLLWTGLLLVAVVRARSAAAAAFCVGGFALALLPSTVWTTRQAFEQRLVAELTALGAAVGVLGQDFDLVETNAEDLARALPLLRERGCAMFAWPETALLGQPLPATAQPVQLTNLHVHTVVNRFSGDGSEVTGIAEGAGGRLVLCGKDHLVCGLLTKLPFDAHWRGFVRGHPAPGELTAARLP